ncbi:MAG TPA: M56 family metallopeptidase [Mucilaginibacter sp.]|nr:M56 family metallopeptidase [Mucilaginibacter sp.]
MGHDLQQLLPENITQALCRTLINSLWQGLIMAVLTGLIMLLTRKSSAAKRYLWLVGVLCLFTLSFLFTLIAALNSQPYTNAVAHNGDAGGPSDIWELLNYNLLFIQNNAGIIVLIWLLVVCARSFKMLFGFYAVERLKRSKISRPGSEWEQKVNALAQTMGIKRAIGLLESTIIKVPVAIGYLKPLILIPVGMVNALDPQELEAILLHELAHIHRRDYLANLLQSFVETIFFFNPAVLWLSSLIRSEREHCCDDVAVSHTKNKVRYISALIHFEEYSLSAPGYALALTGKSGGMLQRLERMAANRNRSLNKLELAGLALLMLLSTLLIAARPGPAIISVATKTARAPMSPALRKFTHDRELAARKRFLEQKEAAGTATKAEALELLRYTGATISPELRKYYQERERATGRRLRAEEAARHRTHSKDSVP